MTYLNEAQLHQLLQPINPRRVRVLKGNSYVEAHDIKAHLTRIFGFGNWDSEVISCECIYERFGQNSKGNDAVSVGYRVGVTLTVYTRDEWGVKHRLAAYTEYAADGSTNQPLSLQADAHDKAMKSAASSALKRCAINLGDQYGLSLYNGGSVLPLVIQTLDGGNEPEQFQEPEVKAEQHDAPREVEVEPVVVQRAKR